MNETYRTISIVWAVVTILFYFTSETRVVVWTFNIIIVSAFAIIYKFNNQKVTKPVSALHHNMSSTRARLAGYREEAKHFSLSIGDLDNPIMAKNTRSRRKAFISKYIAEKNKQFKDNN